jgi:hypothetical protein
MPTSHGYEELDMKLDLATVEDATNIGCRVRFFGATTWTPTRYANKIQEAGVVIRNCHIVVVNCDRTPPEIVWRLGTVATVVGLDDDAATYDDGIRSPQTVAFVDRRPEQERQAAPIAIGDTVRIQGHSTEQLFVADLVADGLPVHPERLRDHFPAIIAVYDTAHAEK